MQKYYCTPTILSGLNEVYIDMKILNKKDIK